MRISRRAALLLFPVALLVAASAHPEQLAMGERASSQPAEECPPSGMPEEPATKGPADDRSQCYRPDGSQCQPHENAARSPAADTEAGGVDVSVPPVTYDSAAHAEAVERLPSLEEIQGIRDDMIPAQQLARSPRQPATTTDPWAPMFSGIDRLGGALAVRRHRARLNAAIEERREGIRTALSDVSTWEGFEVMALQYGLSSEEILIAKELVAPRIVQVHRTREMKEIAADRAAVEDGTSAEDSDAASVAAAAFAAGVLAGRAEAGIATYSDYIQESMKEFGGPAIALERARRSLCSVLFAVGTSRETNSVPGAFVEQMKEEARFFECEKLNEFNTRR